MINKDYLQATFEYKNGTLYWREDRKSNKVKNKQAGSVHVSGYIVVRLQNKLYFLHRLIFLYHHGFLPKNVDHIDGNKQNNKIENLREATTQENQFNAKKSQKNTSGYKNVSFCKNSKKWFVQLRINKKNRYIGYFADIELADLVAQEARDKYHKEFARSI